MADFFEIDFLEVHTSKSGDAISIRYEQGGEQYIHVVDGGYEATGPKLVSHINKHYDRPGFIDHVVATHPDQDHAQGLATILESFSVGTLWVLLPWNYIDHLMPRFERYTNPENLKNKLKKAYPYIARLEEIANERGIEIREPFQGAQIGAFTVMAPTPERYLDLVVTSAKTPEHVVEDSFLGIAGQFLVEAAKRAKSLIRRGWGAEDFPSDGTSNENEMSVVQFARLCGKNIVLTADTGRDGLAEAADYAPYLGLSLPGGVDRFQVPHHGGRHNVSTEMLDRWFGPRLASEPAQGQETFTSVVSAADEDEDHPRKVVVRAFKHRGAKWTTTEGEPGGVRTSHNAPPREGWGPVKHVPYPDEMEE
ncbi:ComEC/Rec2 family competence protein [Methylobacterium gossipiicola]|uniref:Metallo-beta-lactamase superfamily protein n=1 Tax=Methylobacterium gossipiicola TaxID=582675 RepID=A0A1I2UXH7_9HYPH|nr:MBL fold metallo-hydrolase [Methylobacterium gossipiicola]SFG79541.1 Metallo-beta-lactamase superfamily protein [Methylobacterium gossipiicola]